MASDHFDLLMRLPSPQDSRVWFLGFVESWEDLTTDFVEGC